MAAASADRSQNPQSRADRDNLWRILSDDPALQPWLAHAERYRIQIIYTQVRRDTDGHPQLKTASFREDADFYYPASLAKLPVALLALERLKALGLERNQRLEITSINACTRYPPSACASVGECIERLFVFSENDAFNRLYEFLGRDAINRRMRATDSGRKGYRGWIQRRFKPGCDDEDHALTAPLAVIDSGGRQRYRQPLLRGSGHYPAPRADMRVGRATMTAAGRIEEAMDFSGFNYYPLGDFHRMLIAVVLPDAVPTAERFDLRADDRAFLLRAMAMVPREYGATERDSFRKFLLLGADQRLPRGVRITNKVGLSYGFLTDVAYIEDQPRGVAFFLSATIFVNDNGVMNDGQYEYDTKGYPFMKALGQAIYRHEIEMRGRP